MIKKIQLRGISRTPSDRMTEDGGVAESINAYVADGECAPMLSPKDVYEQDESLRPASTLSRCIHIHKVAGHINYIYIKQEDGVQTLFCMPGNHIIRTLTDDAVIEDSVTSIGNTLIFATGNGNGYALWKDGRYIYLGDSIPQPQIDCYPDLYYGSAKLYHQIDVYDSSLTPDNNDETKDSASLYMADKDAWNAELQKESSERSTGFKAILRDFWNGVQDDLLDSQYFRYPVFVRFALKLYDGNHIYHTVPILMGGGSKRVYDAKLIYNMQSRPNRYTTSVAISSSNPAYKIHTKLKNAAELENWKDVIQSVDMYITAPAIYPEINSELVYCDEPTSTSTLTTLKMHFEDHPDSIEEIQSVERVLLEGSHLFYKMQSFSVDNLNEFAEGVQIKNSKDYSYKENLYTREVLEDDFRTNHIYVAERNRVVNSRLLSMGMSELFSRGMQSLYAIVPTVESSSASDYQYSFVYIIKDNDGSIKQVFSPSAYMPPILNAVNVSNGNSRPSWTETTYASDASQILFYPDTRCIAVYIRRAAKSVRLEMKAHPYLNCAYWIGDVSKTIADLPFKVSAIVFIEDRKGNSYKDYHLFLSELENPFYYPAYGRQKFGANVITAAGITTALSQGQYGQFDLYVFTSEGIDVLKPNDEGHYLQRTPLSRDVVISDKAVVSIDQAIVFVTNKGAMLLSGSQIVPISPDMHGEHYVIEESARTIVDNYAPIGYEPDNSPFMRFMQDGVQIAYDYAGGRLIFLSEAHDYTYVYMLSTSTWHKYKMPDQDHTTIYHMRALNSYPDCYVFLYNASDDECVLYNFSTFLDVASDEEQTAIIATRSIDLDEADVLKTINNIKVRGKYEPKDASNKLRVGYLVLGSQDGIHYNLISSLRGKSWKSFRIIIVARLKPTERISYLEIDYETRFKNKLR